MHTLKQSIQKIEELLKEGKHKDADNVLKMCLIAHGMGDLIDVLDQLGHKIHIKRKNIIPSCELNITNHARLRTNTYLKAMGREPISDEKMSKWVMSGPVIEYADMLAGGYRPRKENAEKSIYVSIGSNMVAVLELAGTDIHWITTLSSIRTPHNRIPISEDKINTWCKNKKSAKRRGRYS